MSFGVSPDYVSGGETPLAASTTKRALSMSAGPARPCGFGGFRTARRTLAGYEAMAMVRKGQVRRIGGRDIRAQAILIAELFQIAA